MRIAVVGGGSQGDLQPLATLAIGLSKSGHKVRFAAHESWRFLTSKTELEYFSLDQGDLRQAVPVTTSGQPRTPWSKLSRFSDMARGYPAAQPLLDACDNADYILLSHMTWPVAHIAEKLNLPCAVASPVPYFRTGAFPRPIGPLFLHRHHLGRAINRLSHFVAERLIHRSNFDSLQHWRETELQLPRLALSHPDWAESRRIPQLYGFSTAVIPKPPDWPPWHQVTGYWYGEPDPSWEPPKDVSNFLADRRRPIIFVGFASSVVDPSFWTDVMLPALQVVGCRAILGAGRSLIPAIHSSEVLSIESCPYGWLFPRVDAVIHAAGASTVAEVVRSGKPSVSLPMFGEQRFFAARLERLGVSPRPLTLPRLTAPSLALALARVLNDERMRRTARELASVVSMENGVLRAIDAIEQGAAKWKTSGPT